VEHRERAFWDEAVPPLERSLDEYHHGPCANTTAMLDALEPLHGKSVLDFACGTGVLSAWLAERGARAVGVDISPGAIAHARDLAAELNQDSTFVTGSVADISEKFDRVCGRYALHHTDVAATAPLLADRLVDGGRGAFLETMALNPFLNAGRKLLDRGVRRLGTIDEHPLTRADLRVIRSAFGGLRLAVGEMKFLQIFDRNVLGYRHAPTTRFLADLDGRFGSRPWLSYHQVLIVGQNGRRSSS
jgi:SAM-dependent methyltransferase